MRLESILSSFVIVAVTAVSIGFAVTVEPEEMSVVSADGAVVVTGLVRQTQPLAIEIGRAVQTPLLGSAYMVTPDSVTLDESVVVSFAIPVATERVDQLSVFRFHPELQMWEPVAPVVAHTDDMLAIETAWLGTFALGTFAAPPLPVFADVYAELLAEAPANTVGYEIAVGVRHADEEIVRVLEAGERGGCGGVVRVGDNESLSHEERTVSLIQDGETLSYNLVLTARWFVSSTGGCAATEELRPLVEYDILDEIQP